MCEYRTLLVNVHYSKPHRMHKLISTTISDELYPPYGVSSQNLNLARILNIPKRIVLHRYDVRYFITIKIYGEHLQWLHRLISYCLLPLQRYHLGSEFHPLQSCNCACICPAFMLDYIRKDPESDQSVIQ